MYPCRLLCYAICLLTLCSCAGESVQRKGDALAVMDSARRVRAHVLFPEEYASLVSTYIDAERLLAEGREDEAEALFLLVSGKGALLNTQTVGEALLREASRSVRPSLPSVRSNSAPPVHPVPSESKRVIAVPPLRSSAQPTSSPSAAPTVRSMISPTTTAPPRLAKPVPLPARSNRKSSAIPAETTLYLTFDDGPSPVTLPIARFLKQAGIPATFFVVGERIKGQEKIVRETRTLGHVVANHTQSHDIRRLRGGKQSLLREISSPGNTLDLLGGLKHLVRIPYGSASVGRQRISGLDDADVQIIDWDVDSGDTTPLGVQSDTFIVRNVLAGLKYPRKRNIVVLFHDSTGHGKTCQALKLLIPELKKAGYRFAGLDLQSPVTWVKKRTG